MLCFPWEKHTKKMMLGHKKGVGGSNEDVQLYTSFTYEGVEYFLYDCVYMYRDSELDIGKIVRIWETTSHIKKVKVVWFFRPIEIRQWFGECEPRWNEIFLASGEGKGLFNDNPLEAICGKCNVICTSKDKRNPQASKEELRMADYIFHRTFDVARCRISPIFPDVIAGTRVNHFFNKEKDRKFITSEVGVNLKGKIAKRSSLLKVEEGVTVSRNPVKDVKIDTSPKPEAKAKAELKHVRNLSPTNLWRKVQVSPGSAKKDPAKVSFTLRRVPDAPNSVIKNLKPLNGDKGSKSDSQFLEITRKPAIQSSNWFEQQDIVWSAFKTTGEAKMVPRQAFSSPHHGQAFFIFKSTDAAEHAISELKGKYLMLPNGRPLVGRKGCPVEPNNPTRFPGHLVLDKLRFHKQKTEWKTAVSTSHYSQPNTSEYDMALEWIVLQKKSRLRWDALYKKHAKEIECLRSQLKIHHDA